MHQFAQQNEIDVAVDEARSRRAVGRGGAGETDAGFVAAPRGRERHVGLQSGKVSEEIADGDVALAALEFGDVLGDLVVELKLTLLEQLHERRRRGDDLRKGCNVENGIERHGLGAGDFGAIAVGLSVDHIAGVANDEDRAGHPFLGEGLVDGVVNRAGAGEILGGESVEGGGSEKQAAEMPHMFRIRLRGTAKRAAN